MTDSNQNIGNGHFRIVGRPDIDLSKYMVEIHGRKVVDYTKLKKDNPKVYAILLKEEHEANMAQDSQLVIDKNRLSL